MTVHASHPLSNLPPGPVAVTLETSTFFVSTRNRTAGERGARLRQERDFKRGGNLWNGTEETKEVVKRGNYVHKRESKYS